MAHDRPHSERNVSRAGQELPRHRRTAVPTARGVLPRTGDGSGLARIRPPSSRRIGAGSSSEKTQRVGLLGQSRQQRPVERRMRPDRSRQNLVAGIGDVERHFQIGIINAVSDLEPKREGIAGARRFIVGKHQLARIRSPARPTRTGDPAQNHAASSDRFCPDAAVDRSSGDRRSETAPASGAAIQVPPATAVRSLRHSCSEHSSAPSALMVASMALPRSVCRSVLMLHRA